MIETVTIETCAGGRGHGVAHAGGLALFVPGAFPGDVVEVEVEPPAGARRWAPARVRRLLEPSADRVVPACVHACADPARVAVACGGCPWMGLALERQREQKLGIVARAFSSARNPVPVPDRILSGGPDLGYRCRLRMNAVSGRLGFFAQGSREVVAIPACPMVPDPGAHAGLAPFLPSSGSAELRWLYDGRGGLHLTSDVSLGAGFDRLAEALPGLVGARIAGREAGADGLAVDTPGHGPVTVSSAGFFQAGPHANRMILDELARLLGALPDPGPVLECYAGSGNLTRVLRRFADVVAIESDPQSARFFDRNLAAHPGPGSARLLSMKVEEAIRDRKITGSPRTVVLDPPREGLDKNANEVLVSLAPAHVILVSCDPMAGARDAAVWIRSGWTREEFVVIDTMPHTQHAEIIQYFKKP
jgi:23S rRNA (uracil1939-C5)-methyltransferase